MSKYTSPVTNKVYEVADVAPALLRMIMRDVSETDESVKLRLELANLQIQVRNDKEALQTRSDISEKQREALTQIVKDSELQIAQIAERIMAITKVSPATVCEVLRTFVVDFENLSDAQIKRIGPDFDILLMYIRQQADKDSDKYNAAIDFFLAPKKQATASDDSKTS